MSLGTILIVVLVLMLLGVLPTWSHSANWGYLPLMAISRGHAAKCVAAVHKSLS